MAVIQALENQDARIGPSFGINRANGHCVGFADTRDDRLLEPVKKKLSMDAPEPRRGRRQGSRLQVPADSGGFGESRLRSVKWLRLSFVNRGVQ